MAPSYLFKSNNRFLSILYAGTLVGTLDIATAILQTLINHGSPTKMLQFIASGVFGVASFAGGPTYAFYGLLLHYGIAMGWTGLFFLAYPKLKLLVKNRIILGVLYGLFIWSIMNVVVLPFSKAPSIPFAFDKTVVAMLIIVGAVGLPLSFLASRYYTKRLNID